MALQLDRSCMPWSALRELIDRPSLLSGYILGSATGSGAGRCECVCSAEADPGVLALLRSQLDRCGPERLASAPRPFLALDVLLVFLTGVISGVLLVWGCQQRASGAARAKAQAYSPSPVRATSVSSSKVLAAPVFATPPPERPGLTY